MTQSTTFNRYGAIASEIYDIDKPDFALPDTRFHLARFEGFGRPILEPACGSGRTLIPFLQARHDMTGFDSSLDMLDRCRARCAFEGFKPQLAQARYEDFAFDRLFGAILLPVSSFMLIDDFAVALEVLRRFHRALEPGGVLVIDLQGLNLLASSSVDRRRWTTPDGDLLTCEGTRSVTDWFRQRAETVYRYERWRDGRLIETEIDVMAQRYWGFDEFRMALEVAGFASLSVVGNYDRSRGVRGSDRAWTFEAVRA